LKIKKDNRTKFSGSVSKEAVKGDPSQSNFSAETPEQAKGRKQLDDFKCSLPYSDLAEHGAPSTLPKGVPSSPRPNGLIPNRENVCLCISQAWTSFLL